MTYAERITTLQPPQTLSSHTLWGHEVARHSAAAIAAEADARIAKLYAALAELERENNALRAEIELAREEGRYRP